MFDLDAGTIKAVVGAVKDGNYWPVFSLGLIYLQRLHAHNIEHRRRRDDKLNRKMSSFLSDKISEIVSEMYNAIEEKVVELVRVDQESRIEVRKYKKGEEDYNIAYRLATAFLDHYYKEGKNYVHNDFIERVKLMLEDDVDDYLKDQEEYIGRIARYSMRDINTHMRKRLGNSTILDDIEEAHLNEEFFEDIFRDIVKFAVGIEVERAGAKKFLRKLKRGRKTNK